jgi:hypothetical protein
MVPRFCKLVSGTAQKETARWTRAVRSRVLGELEDELRLDLQSAR